MLLVLRQWAWRVGAWIQQRSCSEAPESQLCDTCGLMSPDGCRPAQVVVLKEMLEYEVTALREENRRLERANSSLRRSAAADRPSSAPKRKSPRNKNT